MSKSVIVIILTISYCTIASNTAHAQNSSNELKMLFEQGNYMDALENSRNLLKTYPDDPIYNYYAGASLFHLGDNYGLCIEYLNRADSRLTPKGVWLYKTKAYLYLYRFDEAKRSYDLYSQNFSLKNLITGEGEDWRKNINNLRVASQQADVVTILKRDTLPQNNIVDYINNENNATGSWVNKDLGFFTDLGIEQGEGFYYRFFDQSEKNCFAITGKKGLARNDLDIYYTCLSGDIFEQTVEALPIFINSRENQRYPIFDEKTQTLYFSSKDEKSLGGFDIFYSTYDKSKNRWSYPKNAGFPINSPFDDFLVGTSKEDGWFVATNRYLGQTTFEIVHLKKESGTENVSDPNLLLAMCRFNMENKPPRINNELASAIQKFKGENMEEEEKKEVETTTLEKKEKPQRQSQPQALFNEDQYAKILDYALTLQLKADSVARLAEEKRYNLADIKDHKSRVEEIKAIEKYEAEAREIQKEADAAFIKVRKIELEAETKNTNDSPANKNQVINSIPTNDFKVYSSSPYSNDKPFNFDYKLPEGLLYRIQMGVFSKEISYDHFGGLSPVTGEVLKERGLKKYYIGLFSSFSEADKALQNVQQQGFIDSFIVAWFNGKKVSINRAQDIEKELGK